MAKQWFTTLPDVYYMRQSRKGGRHELLFTCLGMMNKNYNNSSWICSFLWIQTIKIELLEQKRNIK